MWLDVEIKVPLPERRHRLCHHEIPEVVEVLRLRLERRARVGDSKGVVEMNRCI